MDFYLNIKLFFFIVSRGALPIYLLGEIVDNLTRLGSSIVALYKWRQFIYKLKRLNDVIGGTAKEGEEAKEL